MTHRLNRRQVLCSGCLCITAYYARHLCRSCYAKAAHAGTIPITRSARSQAVVEDYVFLRDTATFDEIAERLGLLPESLARALWRAQYRKDPRTGKFVPRGKST